jgi:hypothetical protein
VKSSGLPKPELEIGGKKPQGLKSLGSFGRGGWLRFKENVTIAVPSLSRNNLEVIEKMGDRGTGGRKSESENGK